MSFLTYTAAQMLEAIPRQRLSEAMGKAASFRWGSQLGSLVTRAYCRAYHVDLQDCAQKEGWQSFDAFFTRTLREDTRPQCQDPWVLNSPADGRVDTFEPIREDSTFLVKGHTYSLPELIGNAEDARIYAGGHASVVYLSPRDYHRVHTPKSGVLHKIDSLPGDFYPVNEIGLEHVKNLFARNRRVAFHLELDLGDGPRRKVCVIMVAAIVVGRISSCFIPGPDVPLGVHPMDEPLHLGDELGTFHLGSTAVVLVEPMPNTSIEKAAAFGPIQLGHSLFRVTPSGDSR
jgi:phosphatidylserine decarboxylase